MKRHRRFPKRIWVISSTMEPGRINPDVAAQYRDVHEGWAVAEVELASVSPARRGR